MKTKTISAPLTIEQYRESHAKQIDAILAKDPVAYGDAIGEDWDPEEPFDLGEIWSDGGLHKLSLFAMLPKTGMCLTMHSTRERIPKIPTTAEFLASYYEPNRETLEEFSRLQIEAAFPEEQNE